MDTGRTYFDTSRNWESSKKFLKKECVEFLRHISMDGTKLFVLSFAKIYRRRPKLLLRHNPKKSTVIKRTRDIFGQSNTALSKLKWTHQNKLAIDKHRS